MEITAGMVKDLREQTGAGIMDCRNALNSCEGNVEKAIEILKAKGLAKAEKRAQRATAAGLVETYIHTAGRIGAMVEVNCETDFVARTDQFKEMAHCLAMQVAAMPLKVKKSPMRLACSFSLISRIPPSSLKMLSPRLLPKQERISRYVVSLDLNWVTSNQRSLNNRGQGEG